MVVNRKLLLKHKQVLEELYKCKSKKGIEKWMSSVDLIVIKLVLGIIVDVVYNKIPVLKPAMKVKLRKEETNLKLLAENYTKLKSEQDKTVLVTALQPVIPLFKIILKPLFESSDNDEDSTKAAQIDIVENEKLNVDDKMSTQVDTDQQLIFDAGDLDLPEVQCSVCGNSVGTTF